MSTPARSPAPLLPVRDQPKASTMHKRLLCVRLEGLRGIRRCEQRDDPVFVDVS